MSIEQWRQVYITCVLLGIVGCVGSVTLLYRVFDFGQEEVRIEMPLITGLILVIQLMHLVLERMKAK